MRFDGDPRWRHDDECRDGNLCGECWDEDEARLRDEALEDGYAVERGEAA